MTPVVLSEDAASSDAVAKYGMMDMELKIEDETVVFD
jgi:hypothetical protein